MEPDGYKRTDIMEKIVKILGEEVPVKFCVAVQIAYEEITGAAFSFDGLSKMKNSVALSMAMIVTNKPETKITIDRLMTEANGKETSELTTAIVESMKAWYGLPDVMAEEEKGPEGKN